VKSTEIRDGNNGKRHLYLTIGDTTGEILAVKWSLSQKEVDEFKSIPAGAILTFQGKCSEYNGKPQFIIDAIKTPQEGTYTLDDYVKCSPEKPEDMYDYIVGVINDFEDEEFKDLCLAFYEPNKDKILYWPAAKGHHHAELGGLLWHTKRMIMQGQAMCEIYPFLNKDLLLAGIALHDIEKLNEMDSDQFGIVEDYTVKGKLLGHIIMAIEAIGEKGRKLLIDEEKILLLQHMILAHHGQPEWGSPKQGMFPEAEIIHYIDMIDARMYTMEDALQFVEPGTMTQRNFSLGRELYKSNC
jgi:3'-5' exoribonuclease